MITKYWPLPIKVDIRGIISEKPFKKKICWIVHFRVKLILGELWAKNHFKKKLLNCPFPREVDIRWIISEKRFKKHYENRPFPRKIDDNGVLCVSFFYITKNGPFSRKIDIKVVMSKNDFSNKIWYFKCDHKKLSFSA